MLIIYHSIGAICMSMGGGKLISLTFEFLILSKMIYSCPGRISMIWTPFPLNGFFITKFCLSRALDKKKFTLRLLLLRIWICSSWRCQRKGKRSLLGWSISRLTTLSRCYRTVAWIFCRGSRILSLEDWALRFVRIIWGLLGEKCRRWGGLWRGSFYVKCGGLIWHK